MYSSLIFLRVCQKKLDQEEIDKFFAYALDVNILYYNYRIFVSQVGDYRIKYYLRLS